MGVVFEVEDGGDAMDDGESWSFDINKERMLSYIPPYLRDDKLTVLAMAVAIIALMVVMRKKSVFCGNDGNNNNNNNKTKQSSSSFLTFDQIREAVVEIVDANYGGVVELGASSETLTHVLIPLTINIEHQFFNVGDLAADVRPYGCEVLALSTTDFPNRRNFALRLPVEGAHARRLS